MIKQVLIVLALVGLGAAIGRFTLPAKVVEKEVIKYQEKIVEKKVYVKDTSQKNNKVTVRLVTIKPDGTKTIETKIFDKSEIEITQHGEVEIDKDKSEEKSTEKETIYNKPDWYFSVLYKVNSDDFSPQWGGLVNKRFLGPIYLGGFAFSLKEYGVNLGLSL